MRSINQIHAELDTLSDIDYASMEKLAVTEWGEWFLTEFAETIPRRAFQAIAETHFGMRNYEDLPVSSVVEELIYDTSLEEVEAAIAEYKRAREV